MTAAPETPTYEPGNDDTWVLAHLAEHLTELFHEHASKAQASPWRYEQAYAHGNMLAHLHGLTHGRLGMSPAEINEVMDRAGGRP